MLGYEPTVIGFNQEWFVMEFEHFDQDPAITVIVSCIQLFWAHLPHHVKVFVSNTPGFLGQNILEPNKAYFALGIKTR